MAESAVTCPVCGTRYDPEGTRACSGCPVGPGCGLNCCPNCYYSWVEPDRMAAAGWISRVLRSRRPKARPTTDSPRAHRSETAPTLADVPPGGRWRIAAWRSFSAERRQQLLGYGLSTGSLVRVIQQAAVTVVVVDHTELALERDLARLILVESPDGEAHGLSVG